MAEDALRIIYLEAENVKRLKAIRMKPDRTLVRIEGKNGAGKSAVLDAIGAALCGGKFQPELPVRAGAKRARVKLDLGELQIERRWAASGGTVLEVTGRDGVKMASPQAVLDKLIGDHTFDPLAFIRDKPSEQAKTLKRIVGLDWSKLDEERDAVFDERTAVNREAKASLARTSRGVAKPSDMTPVDIADMAKKYQAAIDHNSKIDAAERRLSGALEELQSHQDAAAALELNLESARSHAVLVEEECDIQAHALSKLERADTGNLSKKFADAQDHNASIEAHAVWEKERFEAELMQCKADGLTERLRNIEDAKVEALQDAKFPIPGLSVDGEKITLNGVPLSQASSAEQLHIAVAIGLADKRPCRVMLVRDGSLLDEQGLKQLHDIAVEYDAQVFLERVADDASPSAVYIEDGEIVE